MSKNLCQSTQNIIMQSTLNNLISPIYTTCYDGVLGNKDKFEKYENGTIILDVKSNCMYTKYDNKIIEIGNLDESQEEFKTNIQKIRITNCKCCGARLPRTNNHIVTCEYCDVTQDAYKYYEV